MKQKLKRRAVLAGAGAALATPALLSRVNAAEVTLRLHSMLPAPAPMNSQFFVPWADEIREASNGAIDVQLFPSMQLGGKPPQLPDQVRQGICDISWTLPVYTPDRFPIAETLALPFMVTNAEKTSVVMHTLMEEFGQDDYAGIKTLAFHTHDGGKLHTRNGLIHTADDLRGLKLRAPNQATGKMLELLGAETVFFPVTEMVVGLSSGVIDGCCLPYEIVPAFKLQELTGFTSAPAPASRGLYANTFAMLMNQAAYEGMSDDLRGVIDAHSGAGLSQRIGRQFDEFETRGKAAVEAQGNTIGEIASEEIAAWREIAEPVHAEWVEKLNGFGHDGAAVLARANELLDAG
ncbi:TRAP-type C4-dicarboxylate transport system substrate-binding protein [Yoonia maritima]|uniref:TRAP-type C4-dicarboxylate transport system substrate-binding protein n=1 Tax=Yoonia maritima TaxID=1435347 RepID=A0A2T0VZJ2_9RHOB|nr:TRAP transporter substrate-binding protein [Yoonia maritima]PRY77753.1 TRAP-type C4-dicarboxylate transport system substrate-binding protein [Yoonia maritima]